MKELKVIKKSYVSQNNNHENYESSGNTASHQTALSKEICYVSLNAVTQKHITL